MERKNGSFVCLSSQITKLSVCEIANFEGCLAPGSYARVTPVFWTGGFQNGKFWKGGFEKFGRAVVQNDY